MGRQNFVGLSHSKNYLGSQIQIRRIALGFGISFATSYGRAWRPLWDFGDEVDC